MDLIYTPTDAQVFGSGSYQKWLSGLMPGATVLLQEFLPADNSMGFEHWMLTPGVIQPSGKDISFDFRHPVEFNPATGFAAFPESYRASHCFMARVVPFSPYLVTDISGKGFHGTRAHKPIYEPFFTGSTRYVYVVENYSENHTQIREYFHYYYDLFCREGLVYHCFEITEPTLPFKYQYSMKIA